MTCLDELDKLSLPDRHSEVIAYEPWQEHRLLQRDVLLNYSPALLGKPFCLDVGRIGYLNIFSWYFMT